MSIETGQDQFGVEPKKGTRVVEQATNIHALLKLNIGDVVSNIEEDDLAYKSFILAI